MKFKFIAFCLVFFLPTAILAGTIELSPVYIDWVGVIGPSVYGHPAGNMEIKITGGTGSPAAVNCSPDYITTKANTPNFNQMLSILLVAQAAQKPLRIGITDDPTLTAFGGRCSLVTVALLK
jgi:hypothetical protein